MANNKEEMMSLMERILNEDKLKDDVTSHGLQTIQQRHTCAHRVDELYNICEEIGVPNLSKQTTV